MSRKVFFSFHFKRDAWRAGQVRNCDLLADEDEYGVIDSVDWEKIEKQGDAAIEKWINDQLKHTTVTVVLIGAETAERDWIDYEIRQSWKRGNALVGLRIHKMKNQDTQTDTMGPNPLDNVSLIDGTRLSSIFKTYDWVDDDGRNNLGTWVEAAYKIRDGYSGDAELNESRTASTSRANAVKVAACVAAPTVITNPARPWAL
jgi:hypothetical protein